MRNTDQIFVICVHGFVTIDQIIVMSDHEFVIASGNAYSLGCWHAWARIDASKDMRSRAYHVFVN